MRKPGELDKISAPLSWLMHVVQLVDQVSNARTFPGRSDHRDTDGIKDICNC
jgi:hypothetical protein